MKLEIINIKNETAIKFEKSLKTVKEKFFDMLSIALDATIYDIDQDKRRQVEVEIDQIFEDEFYLIKSQFLKILNKINDNIDKGL